MRMAWLFLRVTAFALGLGIALPAMATPCPPGFPFSSMCTNIENYIYSMPQAIAPYSSGLRILAAPNPADNSALYIPANLLATLNDTQALTHKTLTNPIINSGTLNGVFLGNPIFAGIPNFTDLMNIGCASGLALDASGNLGKIPCGGGSGGFPITLGSTTISGSSTTTMIGGLTLSGPTLTGNVAGNPNFTGQPMFTGLPSGTCSVGLALDSGSHLVTTACSGGGSGITQLTGPVTAGPGAGSQATTITPTGVTAGNYTVSDGSAQHCWSVAASGQITAITSGACGAGIFFLVQGAQHFGVQGSQSFGVQ